MLDKYPLKVFDQNVIYRPFLLDTLNCIVQINYTTPRPHEIHFHVSDYWMYDLKNETFSNTSSNVKAIFRIKHVYIKIKKLKNV